MNGTWNRRLTQVLRSILALAIVLLFGGMGGGEDNLASRLPLPEKNFVVSITDRTGMQTKSSRLTWEGKVHFRGKYGEATVNVPFAKINQVDFRPANTGTSAYTVATVTLNSGQLLDISLENQSNVYAATPFGELEISVADLRQLGFSE
jgi:hypothetical protein